MKLRAVGSKVSICDNMNFNNKGKYKQVLQFIKHSSQGSQFTCVLLYLLFNNKDLVTHRDNKSYALYMTQYRVLAYCAVICYYHFTPGGRFLVVAKWVSRFGI